MLERLDLLQSNGPYWQCALPWVSGETYYLGLFIAVLIFIPAWLRADTSRSSARCKPFAEDEISTKVFDATPLTKTALDIIRLYL